MSGIEAAGLALAIFPIVLTALENYRETAEVIGDWWKFKRKYIKCKRDVEYYQIAFESNLKQLLLPLICDDDQIGILMSNPGGVGWFEEELDTKLRERLPNAYEAYLDSVNEINGVMRKLTHELGLDKENLDARLVSKKTVSLFLSSVCLYTAFIISTHDDSGLQAKKKMFLYFI